MTEQATGATWRKSSRSGGSGNCVELSVGTTSAAVRDTKDRDGGTLAFSTAAFAGFLSAAKADELRQRHL